MELNDRQFELVANLRSITKVPDNESWGPFEDFMRALAVVIEGAESLVDPFEMCNRFNLAWDQRQNLWAAEQIRILVNCLGSKEEYDRLRDHPNGGLALGRILLRVQETYDELAMGMDCKVEVADILYECRCMARDKQ